MTKIIYTIYKKHDDLESRVNGRTVSTTDKAIVEAFEHANKLYIGAIYAGCVIESIENNNV